MNNKSDNFEVVHAGSKYSIPNYTITPNGIELTNQTQNILFIRGCKPKVTKEEFKIAVTEVNRLAPYLGLGTFDTTSMDWLPSQFRFLNGLGPDFQLEYTHLYNINKDIINKYLNSDDIVVNQDGITHEQLLGMMIYDLNLKNKEVPSRETSIAITKLEEALHRLQDRQKRIQKTKAPIKKVENIRI